MSGPRIRRGPLYMLGATLFFTMMIGAVKIAREELGPFEVIVWRTLVSIPIALAMTRHFAVQNRGFVALRVVLGFLAMASFFTAAKFITLGELAIVSRLQPIVVALLAPLLLGRSERSGRSLWVLLVMGLAGCGLIIWPKVDLAAEGLSVAGVGGLWALAAVVFSAGAHVTVRHLGRLGERPGVIVLWFQIGAAILGAVGYWLLSGKPLPLPPMHLWPVLAAVGLFATLGQALMTRAYKVEQASTAAAASYAAPLFGLVGDVVAFQTFPEPVALVGGAIVIAAGLVLIFDRAQPRPAGATS